MAQPPRLQQLARRPAVHAPLPQRDRLRLGGDRRQPQQRPAALLQQVAGEVVLVHALHDQHHRGRGRVVEARHHRAVEPLVDPPPLGVRGGVHRLDRVVDDDQVAAAAGERAADRGGVAEAAGGGRHLRLGVLARVDAHRREELAVPGGFDHPAEVARQPPGEVVGVARHDDPRRRVVPEHPGREGHRHDEGLQRARRQVDDQPPAHPAAQQRQLVADRLDVPAVHVAVAGVDRREGLAHEARQVGAQDGPQEVGTRRRSRRAHRPSPSLALPFARQERLDDLPVLGAGGRGSGGPGRGRPVPRGPAGRPAA